MSGFRAFVRALGAQPGVQLNPLIDQTDGTAPDNTDQVLATVARLTRGRIDKPFPVNRNNLIAKTGKAESLRVTGLNEAKLQLYEALNNGSAGAVVQRMTSASAAKSYAVANFSGTPTGTAEVVDYSVSATAPTTGFSLYLMHHDCHNDGIKLAIHADKTPISGSATPNKEITLRVLDSSSEVLHEFFGSLDPAATDDYGNSLYLPDVVAKTTDACELVVAANAEVPITSNAYGRSLSGADNWAISPTLVCFTEGGTTYTTEDLDRWVTALRNTMLPYGYLMTGGSQNIQLVQKLGDLGIEANIPVKVDVPGTLSAAAAIAWRAQFGFDTHYVHFNYAPLEAEEPLAGGRAIWGTGGLQIGYSCARNARVNAKGFAPKNYPVAGRDWSVNRAGIRQKQTLDDNEKSDLAKSQINPVIYELYNGGGRFVFTDSLTSAKSTVSYRKLQNVAEMALTIDNWVALQSKEFLQMPMKLYIRMMQAFMTQLLESAQSSDWLVASTSLPNNAAWQFTIERSTVSPSDTVLITYYCCYDGVVRKVTLQQVLVK